MRSYWPAYKLLYVASVLVPLLAFAGARFAGPVSYGLDALLGVVFCVGAPGFLLAALRLRKRAVGSVPGPRVPDWIALPFIIVAGLLALPVVLLVAMLVLNLIFHWWI